MIGKGGGITQDSEIIKTIEVARCTRIIHLTYNYAWQARNNPISRRRKVMKKILVSLLLTLVLVVPAFAQHEDLGPILQKISDDTDGAMTAMAIGAAPPELARSKPYGNWGVPVWKYSTDTLGLSGSCCLDWVAAFAIKKPGYYTISVTFVDSRDNTVLEEGWPGFDPTALKYVWKNQYFASAGYYTFGDHIHFKKGAVQGKMVTTIKKADGTLLGKLTTLVDIY